MSERRSLDGCERKRIYLMRHAEVSYVQADGTAVADPRQVPLTAVGEDSGRMTCDMLADIAFDRAICSGLPRTVQTARLVLAGRDKPRLEMHPALEEIRGMRRRQLSDASAEQNAADAYDPALTAYAFWDAGRAGASFTGGESYEDAAFRVQNTVAALLGEPGWNCMLAVCHGGVNRLLLSWAIGAPLSCMAPFEQDPCCFNIVDFDIDAHNKIRRAVLRGVNISARDTIKQHRQLTTLEEIGKQIQSAYRAANPD